MPERPVEEFDTRSGDGTVLRAWQNTVDVSASTPVLLCPGLGSVPEAWPNLLAPESEFRVASWYHRGTLGSSRPSDPTRITLDDHVQDALAVLDAVGLRRCTVVGWSVGVAVAAELARLHPDRVAGLMLVGGTPGATFDAMFGILGVPRYARRLIAETGTRSLQLLGPLLDAVFHRMPITELSARTLQYSGFMLPGSDPAVVATALRGFLQHDWRWFFTLALSLGATPAVQLDGLTCPLTVVAGRYDMLSDARAMIRAVGSLPQAKMRILDTSHFIPLEAPDELTGELALLLQRAEAVEYAQLGMIAPRRRMRPLRDGARPSVGRRPPPRHANAE
jgi:pimeloyl-ACP methyl ester carboxylesterase